MDEGAEAGARYEIVDGALKRISLEALGAVLARVALTPEPKAPIPFDTIWRRFVDEWGENPERQYDGLSPATRYTLDINERGVVTARNLVNT